MKPDTHPAYHDITVTCACGETFVTGSTKKEIRVEICSKCHPFYTGQRKFVDAEGRVQKFARTGGAFWTRAGPRDGPGPRIAGWAA